MKSGLDVQKSTYNFLKSLLRFSHKASEENHAKALEGFDAWVAASRPDAHAHPFHGHILWLLRGMDAGSLSKELVGVRKHIWGGDNKRSNFHTYLDCWRGSWFRLLHDPDQPPDQITRFRAVLCIGSEWYSSNKIVYLGQLERRKNAKKLMDESWGSLSYREPEGMKVVVDALLEALPRTVTFWADGSLVTMPTVIDTQLEALERYLWGDLFDRRGDEG